jgi:FKBP-type peptidyl-prolyl cis-trans isomerase
MSDDELPPAGDMDGMGGMDDDEDFDDDMGAPAELPEGVTKEIITPSPSENWKKPKAGDEVTVHYVGTLQSDGSEFDSSRSRDKPFVFSLGKGQVIKGWDLGVATMKKGEVAKFTLAPEFAYGDGGSPPKIPEKATLIFEVELISWSSRDDLFGDEGVIKQQLKEGSGWKTPHDGDEVLISLKVVAKDGSVVEEKSNLEYVSGSGGLGAVSKACEKAINGMKKGEEASLVCSKDYCDGEKCPDGVTCELQLLEIYETKDVSFGKTGTVMKKQVKEGEGYDTPKDATKVTLSVEAATDGSGAALPGFAAKSLDFTAGDGEVCDALECAVCEMKKGEKAIITVSQASLATEAQVGLAEVKAEKILLTLVLTDFTKAKETYSMSEEEKVEFGQARKEVGTALFKKGRLAMALQRYKKVGDIFNYIDNFKEENKAKAKELKGACELNKAACHLKLKDYSEAKKSCEAVLKDEKQNVKALYRRAQAECGLKNFMECIHDCKAVVGIDAQNKDARALLKQAQAGQKEVDKQAKGLFANMCKALGKGPIPDPGKTKRPFENEDEEMDEAGADKAEGEDAKAEGEGGDAKMEPAAEAAAAA